MILKKLPNSEFSAYEISQYDDHVLHTGVVSKPYAWQGNLLSPGILSFVQGKGIFRINGTSLTLDENSFLVVNSGSQLAVTITHKESIPVMLFFNSELTKLISESILFKRQEREVKDLHDFTLVEHIHYSNATLKNHLNVLIDLGDSCASFHALKADMIIRTILDDLIHENYSAMQIAENINVIKQSTRIALYKRLSMAKEWMEKNFSNPLTLNQAANIAMLNKQHFLRLFKQAFNITPHQHLIDVRINKAKELLCVTNDPVSVICQRVGFESISSFSTLFKKYYHLSPVQFRKSSEKIKFSIFEKSI